MAVDSSFEKRRACRASKDFVCVTESAGSKTEGVAGYFQGIGGVSRGLSRVSPQCVAAFYLLAASFTKLDTLVNSWPAAAHFQVVKCL